LDSYRAVRWSRLSLDTKLGWDITRTAGGGDRFIIPGGTLAGEEGIEWFAFKEHLFRFLRRPQSDEVPSSQESASFDRMLGATEIRSSSFRGSPVPFPTIPSSETPTQQQQQEQEQYHEETNELVVPDLALTDLPIGLMWKELRSRGWKQNVHEQRGLIYISPNGRHEFSELEDIRSYLQAIPRDSILQQRKDKESVPNDHLPSVEDNDSEDVESSSKAQKETRPRKKLKLMNTLITYQDNGKCAIHPARRAGRKRTVVKESKKY